ncbi:MAG TPA: hypothetical protein DCR95_11795 [Desulfobacter sp.]|nr:hypothetical protein [Desulfobacter sp.]
MGLLFYSKLVRLQVLFIFNNNITRAGQISILHFDYIKQSDIEPDNIKVNIIYIIRPWDDKRIGELLTLK